MSLTFLQLAQKVLLQSKSPLSVDDLWQTALDLGLATELGSTGLTPKATLGARLYVELKDNPASIFAATGDRPKLFYLKTEGYDSSFVQANIDKPRAGVNAAKKPFLYSEKDLHPFVVYFAKAHLSAHLKTGTFKYEVQRSSNQRG